jgi:hypothetical protein
MQPSDPGHSNTCDKMFIPIGMFWQNYIKYKYIKYKNIKYKNIKGRKCNLATNFAVLLSSYYFQFKTTTTGS